MTLFGLPDAVWADSFPQRGGGVADDFAHVVLRWGRVRAILHTGAVVAGPGPRLAVHGTGGSYVSFGLDPQENALRAGASPRDADWGRILPERYGIYTPAQGEPRPYPSVPGAYPSYYAGLARAIRDGSAPPVSARDARDVIRLVELALQSNTQRREVAWTQTAA
jgi:scyllo-inositol 2-dehydrogenase (NADP+)